jgi:hypothetical protein
MNVAIRGERIIASKISYNAETNPPGTGQMLQLVLPEEWGLEGNAPRLLAQSQSPPHSSPHYTSPILRLGSCDTR